MKAPPAVLTLESSRVARVRLHSGVELHHVDAGRGPTVVFVHGVLGDWRSWAPQWPAFLADHRCISYSRRHSTPNCNDAMVTSDHSALVDGEDLHGLINALGLARVILVGSSYGGFVALAMACRHPERVAALVAVEPAMLRYAAHSLAGRLALAAFERSVQAPARDAFLRGDDIQGVALMTAGIHGDSSPALQGSTWQRRLQNARALRIQALSSDEFPLLEPARLATLPMPVMLVSGRNTPTIHAETFRGVCAAMPQAQVLEVANAGHAVAAEQPEAFNAGVLRFLSDAGVHSLPERSSAVG
jgi:pimeloyl-ACP methyl ester carboxylesterase